MSPAMAAAAAVAGRLCDLREFLKDQVPGSGVTITFETRDWKDFIGPQAGINQSSISEPKPTEGIIITKLVTYR